MDAKSKRASDQQLNSIQNTRIFYNHRQPGFSNANKTKQQISKNNDLNGTGLRGNLHGSIYQLKLLMLFLQTALNEKYEFKLYSEEKEAEKFDDIVFQYGKNEQYRFLQAKHTLNPECKKITVSELSSKQYKKLFSLHKYFISFRRIEKKQQYKGKIRDVIICTNTDFNDDIKKKRVIKEETPDDILDIGGGKRYKLIFNKNKDIVEKLKDISHLNRLAKKMATAVAGKEHLDLNNIIFKDYQIPLEKEVFDFKLIQQGTRLEKYCTYKKNFINNYNLSWGAKLLREAFKMETLKVNKNINYNNFWSIVDQKEFIIYEKYTKLLTHRKEKFPNDLISDDDIKRFFEKLIFAVEHPDEQKLDEIIKERIFNSLDDLKDHVHAEIIYDYFLKQMLDWLKNRESTALSNKDDFFKEGKEKVKEIIFRIPYLEYCSFIKKLDINFNSQCNKLQKLCTFLNSKNISNLISSEKNIPLGQAKVYHIIPQPGWYLEDLLNLKKFQNFKATSLFENNRLIIVCIHETETKRNDIKELYNELAGYITEQRNNKIILISQTDSILASYFKEGNLKNSFDQMSDTTRIDDLDQDYLLETLSNKTIIFQGQKKKLPQLINIESEKSINNRFTVEDMHKLERIFNSDTLSELLLNTNIKVGNKLPDFRDSSSPYYDPYHIDIPRTLSYQVIDRNSLKECIKERNEDLFAFSFTNKDYIARNILDFGEKDKIEDFKNKASNNSDNNFFEGRLFMLNEENSEENFKELFKNSNGKTVHWLKYIDNHNFTVEYSGNLSNLRRFIKMADMEKDSTKNSTIVIIFGVAGVGKSTVLTKYSQKLNSLSEWLIRMDLKDHQEYIKNANFNHLEGIIEFFCQCDLVGLKTALAQNLLKYYLEYQGQIILLLDGFDEIRDDNQEKIIQLLKFFRNTKRKIWLTTRLNEQLKIENTLKTIAFSYFLNPFNEKEQEDFLNQYWIKKLKIKESEQEEKYNIAKFTTGLLHYFYNFGLMKENSLIGIVLQARMVAEIICPKPKFNSSQVEINNLSDLYEKFTELQYERYFTQKLDVNIKLLGKGLQIRLINSYTKAHGYLALNALFFEDQSCKKLLKNQKYEEFSQDELSGIGFIKKFRSNYIVDFIHFTYAEYFVAKLFANMLDKKTDDNKYELIREVLLRKIFLDRNNLIRTFLEQEMQKMPNNNNIKNRWKEIQECDLLGKIQTNRVLPFFNLSFIRDSDTTITIQHNVNKTLSELKEYLESSVERWTRELNYVERMNPFEYFFNRDVSIITNFFQQFLEVTDIEKLKNTLLFLIKINSMLKVRFYVNIGFQLWFKENFNNVIKHYLTQIKLQNISNIEFDWEKDIHEFDIDIQEIKNFTYMLDELIKARDSTNQMEKKRHLEKLLDLVIPNERYFMHELRKLNNNVYFLFYTSEQSVIKDINSFRSIQRKYKDRILNILENMIRNMCESNLGKTLENMVTVKYLQSFFIDITHHTTIIANTILSINKIYQCRKDNFNWIAREGILIFRLLEILTPEMSKIFNSVLDNFLSIDRNYIENYSFSNFYNLIYVLDALKTEKLPQINKLVFLKTIMYFINIFMVVRRYLFLTLNQLETILKLLENILNEQQKPVLEIMEIVEFLFTLKVAGLKLINIADQKILILDPINEFQFELSSSYKNQIIELIKEKGKLENKDTDFSITQA